MSLYLLWLGYETQNGSWNMKTNSYTQLTLPVSCMDLTLLEVKSIIYCSLNEHGHFTKRNINALFFNNKLYLGWNTGLVGCVNDLMHVKKNKKWKKVLNLLPWINTPADLRAFTERKRVGYLVRGEIMNLCKSNALLRAEEGAPTSDFIRMKCTVALFQSIQRYTRTVQLRPTSHDHKMEMMLLY